MISIQDVYTAFVGSVPLNFRLLKETCQVTEIEFLPKIASALHVPPDRYGPDRYGPDRCGMDPTGACTCRIPFDYLIAPTVVVTHGWDTDALAIYKTLVPAALEAFTLVDLGANSGLITRQMLVAFPQIKRAFAYEPHPANFACLTHNLRVFHDIVDKRNYAVSNDTGSFELYLDFTNCGNYSLNKASVFADDMLPAITVPVKRAANEALDWHSAGLPIFYKSDTQGHDEIIASDIGLEFWDHVFIGTMELSKIGKPEWPLEKFRAMLDRFPNKIFKSLPNLPVTTHQILAFLGGEGEGLEDIIFWK
jgi:FkbM family methyltransferase